MYMVILSRLLNLNYHLIIKVQGYPTLLTNSEGKIEEYEGPREYESILEHCINKLNITDPEIINIIKSGGRKNQNVNLKT